MNLYNEFEETVKRIQSHRGVVGIVVVDDEGEIIKSTLDNQTSIHYVSLTKELADNAKRCVRNLDPSNELVVLRMGSKKHEISVAPGPDEARAASELRPKTEKNILNESQGKKTFYNNY